MFGVMLSNTWGATMNQLFVSEEDKNQIALAVQREIKRGHFDEALLARASIEFGPDEQAINHGYARLLFERMVDDVCVVRSASQAKAPAADQPKPAGKSPALTWKSMFFGGEWDIPALVATCISLPMLLLQPANVAATGWKANVIAGFLVAAVLGLIAAAIGKAVRRSAAFNRMYWTAFTVVCCLIQLGWRM
jgi:hypothetical protein